MIAAGELMRYFLRQPMAREVSVSAWLFMFSTQNMQFIRRFFWRLCRLRLTETHKKHWHIRMAKN